MKKLELNIITDNDYVFIDIYLKNICINIYHLIKNYCEYYNCNDFKNMKETILHNNNIEIKGLTRKCDIDDIITNGNIRERMTLIYMFGLNGSKIISSLTLDDNFLNYIIDKKNCFIDIKKLNERYERLCISLGLNP